MALQEGGSIIVRLRLTYGVPLMKTVPSDCAFFLLVDAEDSNRNGNGPDRI